MSVNTTIISNKFIEGLASGAGYATGSLVVGKLAPHAIEAAEKVDSYLNSFPLEQSTHADGGREVLLSPPEAALFFTGVGAAMASLPVVGTACAVTAAAMKTRRMYVNKGCTIL
jgi:hypothetical protein